jgi:hypothetical protein
VNATRALLAWLAVGGATASCGSCGSCSKTDDASSEAGAGGGDGSPGDARAVVAEALPRCRADGRELPIPGDEVVAGDAVVANGALVVGVVRRTEGKRVASVVRATLDLGAPTVLDLGPAFGEDPPPSPREHNGALFVAFYTRKDPSAPHALEAGTGGMSHATRELRVARLEREGDGPPKLGKILGTISQQADESTAFDLAWPDARDPDAPPFVAWDEDAPIPDSKFLPDRGRVKVQSLADGAAATVASPWASDADAPQLLVRPGASPGFWLAWLARRTENEDAGEAPEGPGELRAYRWVEVVQLDAKGEAIGGVRRVSPERGRVVSFELTRAAGGGTEIIVLAQDEAAPSEGAGARIIRYAVGDKLDTVDLVDAGVGRALAATFPIVPHANVGPSANANARWLVWSDPNDHAHLLPLAPTLLGAASPTLEPSLDGTRVLATAPNDVVFSLTSASAIRRLTCR